MRQPSPSHYASWPRIFGFVLKEAELRLACSSCLYLQERGQGGPLFLDDTEKNFCPPRSGSATELCQLRVLIREETWEITLKYLSQALLSNALNNKNELKSVRLNKFSKTTLNLVILFESYPCLLLYLLCQFLYLLLMFWARIIFHVTLKLVAVLTVWILANFMAQVMIRYSFLV